MEKSKDYSMKSKINFVVLICGILFTINCSNGVHMTRNGIAKDIDIKMFRKLDTGMTTSEIEQTLGRKHADKFPLEVYQDTFYILKYLANLGQAGNVQGESTVLDLMYLLTKSDTLIYWGLSQKYRMSKDSTKSEIINRIIEKDSVDYKAFHNDISIHTPYHFVPQQW
jgi:hypothetical protein